MHRCPKRMIRMIHLLLPCLVFYLFYKQPVLYRFCGIRRTEMGSILELPTIMQSFISAGLICVFTITLFLPLLRMSSLRTMKWPVFLSSAVPSAVLLVTPVVMAIIPWIPITKRYELLFQPYTHLFLFMVITAAFLRAMLSRDVSANSEDNKCS